MEEAGFAVCKGDYSNEKCFETLVGEAKRLSDRIKFALLDHASHIGYSDIKPEVFFALLYQTINLDNFIANPIQFKSDYEKEKGLPYIHNRIGKNIEAYVFQSEYGKKDAVDGADGIKSGKNPEYLFVHSGCCGAHWELVYRDGIYRIECEKCHRINRKIIVFGPELKGCEICKTFEDDIVQNAKNGER